MQSRLKKLTVTSMFTAMIFVVTRFLQVPVGIGYIHLGDVLVYMCACLMGNPWALIAGGIGQALADVASGFSVYAPATFLIKAIVAVIMSFAKNNTPKILTKKSAILTIPSGVIVVAGYFIADTIVAKGFAFTYVYANIIQALGSSLVFIILAAALDKSKIKTRIIG